MFDFIFDNKYFGTFLLVRRPHEKLLGLLGLLVRVRVRVNPNANPSPNPNPNSPFNRKKMLIRFVL